MTAIGTVKGAERVEVLLDPSGPVRAFDRAQRNANQSVRRLNMSPAGFGRFIDVDFTSSTTQQVQHQLALRESATPAGWTAVDQDAAATFYRSAWDRNTVTFVASAACKARFWVFA